MSHTCAPFSFLRAQPLHTTAGPLLFLSQGQFQLSSSLLRLRFTASRMDMFSIRASELSKDPQVLPWLLQSAKLSFPSQLCWWQYKKSWDPFVLSPPRQEHLCSPTAPIVLGGQDKPSKAGRAAVQSAQKWLRDFQHRQPVSRCWKPTPSPPQTLNCFSETNFSGCSTSKGPGSCGRSNSIPFRWEKNQPLPHMLKQAPGSYLGPWGS